jgi:hypothetical protein
MSDVYACTQFVCVRHAARKRQLICGEVELAHAELKMVDESTEQVDY